MKTFGVIAVFALQAFGAVNHGSKLVEVHGLKLSLKWRVRAVALGVERDADDSMKMESKLASIYQQENMIMPQLQQIRGALATINNVVIDDRRPGTYLRETASSPPIIKPLSNRDMPLFNGADVTILDTDLVFLADEHVPMVKVRGTHPTCGKPIVVVGWLELNNLRDVRQSPQVIAANVIRPMDQEELDAARKQQQQQQPVPPAPRPPQPAPQPGNEQAEATGNTNTPSIVAIGVAPHAQKMAAMVKKAHKVQHVAVKKSSYIDLIFPVCIFFLILIISLLLMLR